MYFDVKHAELSGSYLLKLQFEDGSAGNVDLKTYIKAGTVFERFNDLKYLATMRIEYGALVWGEGEVDIAPEALYSEATGRAIDYHKKDRAVS